MAGTSRYTIEIAVNDLVTAAAAVEGGADRLELCSALSEGGLTPSYGFMRRCRELFSLPIFPIIRERGGDFLYSEEEYNIMLEDARLAKSLGFDGVVAGFLLADGRVDALRTRKLVEAVYPLEVTFHRAFDRCRDPFEALETIIDCGCQRILTSGQQPSVLDALDRVQQLVAAADHRIIILPGSGIRVSNIRKVAEATGAAEFHSSLRTVRPSEMTFRHPSFEPFPEEFSLPAIRSEEVKALKAALAT
ncbi:MAG TPA: copper homeostasis protein CutC [Chitinophagaceae bacterium]|jgi:copper homeostasis protein|nr:copper homeostasis protein CutC [Chitinophagaceae bacterium]